MRITFVSLGFAPLRLSGLDLSGERLVQGFLEAGHEVNVISGRLQERAEVVRHPALTIRRVPLGASDWIGFGRQVSLELQKIQDADIVHFWDVHFGYAYRGAYVASLQHSFQQRLRGLGEDEGSPLRTGIKALYYHLARRLAEEPAIARARGLVAGSRTTRDAFVRDYKVDPDRIAVARHGIDTNFFRPLGSQGELREKLGLHPERPVLLFAGFITPRKGITYLANAVRLIEPAPQLVLLGRWRNPGLREQVRAIVGDQWPDIIEPGFVPDSELPAYYSLADVYVSASLMEGFGLPLAEALACETPVVAANAGSVAEVVGPGGRLVPPRDPVALAAAVSELLGDAALRERLGQAGAAHVRASFGIGRMVGDMLAAYRQFSV